MIALTSHVLDTIRGGGAGNVRIDLARREGQTFRHIETAVTRADGRTEFLGGAAIAAGEYELTFYIGDYFAAHGVSETFLDIVPVWFTVTDPTRHYHVPLVAGPAAFSTYRGGLPPAGGAVLPPEMAGSPPEMAGSPPEMEA